MESERLALQESLPGSQTRMNNLEVGHYECLFFKCLVVVTSKSSHLLIVFIIIIIIISSSSSSSCYSPWGTFIVSVSILSDEN